LRISGASEIRASSSRIVSETSQGANGEGEVQKNVPLFRRLHVKKRKYLADPRRQED
jgi:hypothetical protein